MSDCLARPFWASRWAWWAGRSVEEGERLAKQELVFFWAQGVLRAAVKSSIQQQLLLTVTANSYSLRPWQACSTGLDG